MKSKSFEVSVTFKNKDGIETSILRNILSSLKVKEEEIIEQDQNGMMSFVIYKKDSRTALQLKNRLLKLKLKKVKVQYKSIETKDWQTVWKKDFKPFSLTKNFDLVPYAYRNSYQSRKEHIYIDTSFAFGTGLHATTRFMAQFLDQMAGQYTSVMDIGTGTGILSILAAKCGATELFAFDLSQEIIKIARENFKENNVPSNGLRAVNFTKLQSKKKYDYVAANLITQDLILFKRKILSFVKPGGYLAISGISLQNYSWLRDEFKSAPLRCLKIKKGEGWVALLFKRKG